MHRRRLLKSVLAGVAGAAVPGLLSAPARAGESPSRADLAGDMGILREALQLHPGLHRYAMPAQTAARLDALGAAFVAAPDAAHRYLLLARFLATIRCGHSYANFFNQSPELAAALFDRPTRLPFHFVWIGEAMVVTRDPTGQLPPGTVVEQVNGEDVAALRRRLMPYVRADGHNDAKRISLLEVRGDERIETFDVFQGLIAPPRGAEHRLRVRLPGASAKLVAMPAVGLAARQAAMTAPRPTADDAAQWQWRMDPGGTAILTMPGWAMYDSKWNWRGWLDDRLDSLGGARGLIVDLRDNEGGDDCGNVLLARLIARTFVPPRIEQRVRFRRTPAALDRYLDTWDDSFRTLGEGGAALPGGFFLRPGADDAVAIEPAPRRLAVPVTVLTSAVNSSATFQFASHVRTLGAGRLLGGATGGNRRGINGGCFFFVRLPASGIEFDLPLVGYFPLDPQPDSGLLPDVAVAAGAADIAAGRDVVLERALSLS